MKKNSFILVLALLMTAGFYTVSFAGISASPHDVVSWTNATAHGARINTGVCSYCHIPHSAKGDRLFPQSSDTTGLSKSSIGTVAFLCAQCHSTLSNDFDYAWLDASNEMIFGALGSPDRTANDALNFDTHPVNYSSVYLANPALNVAEATSTTKLSEKWPYYADWLAGKKDIECTSCHNPHDWNQNTRRNYLRIKYFDSAALDYDTQTVYPAYRNICGQCHTGRDSSAKGTSNAGTHPVGNIVANPSTMAPAAGYEGIWFDTLNFYNTAKYSVPRFFKKYYESAGVGLNSSGKAVGDRGAHLGDAGELTCMSCHLPHGAPNSRDGVIRTDGSQLDLVVGPLLVKDNDIYGTDLVSGFAAGGASDHWQGETSFALIGTPGESNLCEWCHGLTPKKTDSTEGNANVAILKYSHPVNNYPTSTADNSTYAYISNLNFSETFSTVTELPLRIRYPVNNYNTAVIWVNYEESGAPNDPLNTAGAVRRQGGTAQYLVCMSCHDAHFALAGTPILRDGSSPEFCEDCHFTRPVPGATHPIKRYEGVPVTQNCDLTTEDGGTLPNYANLYLEAVNPTAGASGGEVVCRTCHGGEFGTGVIHGGLGRFMLADYIAFGEICVNCHGYDTHGGLPGGYSKARLDLLRVGAAADKSANPSYWYREGPSPVFADGVDTAATQASCYSRVGSHYVGAIYAGRPFTGDATYGWLGGSDTTQDHRGELENTTLTKWLDTTWFAPVSGSNRRMWETARDGVGVAQYSIIGYIGETTTQPVIICLSCHTPHGAAQGQVGSNGPVDNINETTNWDGELLLAKNTGSYICYICHLPAATHPVDFPETTHIGHKYDTSVLKNPTNDHAWVTRTDTTINVNDSTDPNKVVRDTASLIKPANYPYGKVVCESCHSAHSANSRWGSYILEGDTTRAPNLNAEYNTAAWSTAATVTDIGKHNKRPMVDHNNADTVKSVNDRPTCEMCHPQGTE